MTVKESAIEYELVKRVEARGGVCIKLQALGRRGFPDRLVVLPGGVVHLVELKRPHGGRISPHQRQYMRRFTELGVAVVVVRNSADIDQLLP